jgi:segregation and condensation protein B
MNNLESKIEAILFFKGEPVSVGRLSDILKVSKDEVKVALGTLRDKFRDRGIMLLEKDEEFTLGTSSQFSDLIEKLQKEELNKELSKANLETLSIILYKNGANRALIDYIRGVNSSFTLRALSVRGLIEKTIDPVDHRRYIYKPSFELLSFMGVTKVEELPDYSEVSKSISSSEEELKIEVEKEETENS